jgi:glycosyltransferase involved in cell wall biosynthesis
MKVAFLSFDFGEYCIPLASALAQEAEVLLLLPQREADPHLSKLDPRVHFRPFHKPRLRQFVKQMWMLYTLIQHIRQFNPDVIHLQQGHFWFNFVLPLFNHYPLVLTIHDPRAHVGDRGGRKTPQMVMNLAFRRATQVIVHAKKLQQEVVEQLHISGGIVHTIPHIRIGDTVAQNHVQEEDHLILFFGRIWEYKGLKYLIRAEPLITAQIPDAKIMIAGEGEDFAPYRRMMIHPENFIISNEYIAHDKCAELFRRASVVVLPYIDASQSGVIPVAYTFAKPVVATTVGGLPEAVDHGRTGYLVPPRDERALAEAIVRLLRDKELRRQLGVNGRPKVNIEWSPHAVAHRTLTVYRCALGSVRAGE